MTMDIQDLCVLQMPQTNKNKIISTFETMIFCFECFEKITSRLIVHYSCILINIRHLINLKLLA